MEGQEEGKKRSVSCLARVSEDKQSNIKIVLVPSTLIGSEWMTMMMLLMADEEKQQPSTKKNNRIECNPFKVCTV